VQSVSLVFSGGEFGKSASEIGKTADEVDEPVG
jgi:hypothetical protein